MFGHRQVRNGRLQPAGVLERRVVRSAAGVLRAEPGKRLRA